MPEVEFEVDIKTRRYLVEIDAQVMQQIIEIAKARHVSAEILVNTWLEEQTRKAA